MPVIYTEKLWRSLYAVQDGEEWITYGRRWWELGARRMFERRAEILVDRGVSGRVLVVGAGFGYLIEALLAHGISAAGIDASPWIAERHLEEMGAPVLHAALEEYPFDYTFDWVIDEDCLPGYTREEAPAFLDACEWHLRHGLPPDRVVHIVTTSKNKPWGGDSAMPDRLSAEEWRALRPSHTWLPDI